MHKIKSAARHSAYKEKYNPFSRTSTRSSRTFAANDIPDIENNAATVPIRRASTHSENCAEEIERDNAGPAPKDQMKHASTMPTESSEPSSATSTHPPIGAFQDPRDEKVSGEPSEKTLIGNEIQPTTTGASRHFSRPSLIGGASFRAFGKRKRGDAEKQKQQEEEDKSKSKFRQRIPPMQQARAVLFPGWLTINYLLFAVPVGIAVAQVDSIPPIAVFLINFVAIIPLAGILSYATEEIALRVGETLGGLLNASFGNAVELIVGIIALVKDEIVITQTSLIGSMLSNLLLVLGMCFFFGGLNRIEQNFNVTVAQTAASLLALSAGALLIPTAFTWSSAGTRGSGDEDISRGTSIIMLVIYGSYLYFQLKTHKEIYNAPSEKVEKRKGTKKDEGETIMALAHAGAGQAAHVGGAVVQHELVTTPEDEEEDPQLSLFGALFTLCASTALVGVCAEFMVDSISAFTCTYHVSQYFVGLILLPIVGNAAEHVTAVTVAIKDKMDLAIGVAVGSSMQIALLVLPLMVIIGWIADKDMTLVFDDFQIAILFVAVLLVNYLIGDGKSHWMEGVLLMSLYIIIALASWYYPTQGC